MMKKIAVLVVTFNRMEILKKWLTKYEQLELPHGCDVKLYIVDNASTDGTTEYLATLAGDHDNIKCKTLECNKGGAGGFAAGLKWAFSEGNDFVWGMDDDAFPHRDALVNLINEYETLREKEGAKICLSSNSTNESGTRTHKQVVSWMFVGFFIPRSIYEEIGDPREDFFIYCDDAEYAKRICKKYKIFKVYNSVIDHSVGGPETIERKVFGKNMWCYRLPDWKQYYFVRNRLLMCKYTERRFWGGMKHDLIYCLNMLFVNPVQLWPVVLGTLHGILRISGKRMSP